MHLSPSLSVQGSELYALGRDPVSTLPFLREAVSTAELYIRGLSKPRCVDGTHKYPNRPIATKFWKYILDTLALIDNVFDSNPRTFLQCSMLINTSRSEFLAQVSSEYVVTEILFGQHRCVPKTNVNKFSPVRVVCNPQSTLHLHGSNVTV